MPLDDTYVDYIIQEHKSKGQSRTHWDFRFGYLQKNALKSYAIPSCQFPKIGAKCLAVNTVDHSKSWLGGHDDIEDGKYGAGTYKTIQSGKMQVLGWGPGYITFTLSGSEINGRFTLIRFQKSKTSWTLIGLKDKEYSYF